MYFWPKKISTSRLARFCNSMRRVLKLRLTDQMTLKLWFTVWKVWTDFWSESWVNGSKVDWLVMKWQPPAMGGISGLIRSNSSEWTWDSSSQKDREKKISNDISDFLIFWTNSKREKRWPDIGLWSGSVQQNLKSANKREMISVLFKLLKVRRQRRN